MSNSHAATCARRHATRSTHSTPWWAPRQHATAHVDSHASESLRLYRPLHPAPAAFFYSFVGAILTLMLIFKGGNTSANASYAAKAQDDKFVVGLASGLVALVLLPLAAVYVSYWQYRTTWMGEKFHGWEYLYFWAIPKRERRPGFDARHLGEPSFAGAIKDAAPLAADAESAPATPSNGVSKDDTVVAGVGVKTVLTAVLEGTEKYHNEIDLTARSTKIVPPEITAALAVSSSAQNARATRLQPARGHRLTGTFVTLSLASPPPHLRVCRSLRRRATSCARRPSRSWSCASTATSA